MDLLDQTSISHDTHIFLDLDEGNELVKTLKRPPTQGKGVFEIFKIRSGSSIDVLVCSAKVFFSPPHLLDSFSFDFVFLRQLFAPFLVSLFGERAFNVL